MASRKIKIVDEKSEKEYTREEIIDLMKLCKTQKRLADHIGVDQDTITNTKKSDKEFSDAIDAGKRAWTQEIIDKLVSIGAKGDLGAIKYILNNVEPDEWADKIKQETKIEGELSLTDYLKSKGL